MQTYVDGRFDLYRIKETDEVSSRRYLEDLKMSIWYHELSISDRLRSALNATNIDPSLKIRIPQFRELDSLSVLKIGDQYFKVYNAYHFVDRDGCKQSDLTLTRYYDFEGIEINA